MNIDDLSFVRRIKPRSNSGISVSLYKDPKQRLVVLKSWQNKFYNLAYYNFLSEIRNLQKLQNSSLNIPEILFVSCTQKQLILATRYIKGEAVESITSFDKQLKYYQHITKLLASQTINSIKTKTISHYLVLFPILWTKAVLQNLNNLLILLKFIPVYLSCALSNLDPQRVMLVHGDLNFKNLILQKNKLYIIDLEQTCRTFPEFELASSLSVFHSPEKFKKYLFNQIITLSRNNPLQKRRLVFAILNCSLHNLTWHASQKYLAWYLKLMHFAIDLYEKS